MHLVTKCPVCFFRFKNSMGRWVEVTDLTVLAYLHIITEENHEICPSCAVGKENDTSILSIAFQKGSLAISEGV